MIAVAGREYVVVVFFVTAAPAAGLVAAGQNKLKLNAQLVAQLEDLERGQGVKAYAPGKRMTAKQQMVSVSSIQLLVFIGHELWPVNSKRVRVP